MADLKTQLHLTVHSCRSKSVEELADEMGISASYLYRAVLDGDSGCRFPLDLLIPLMHATGDYRVLELINARCNRLTVSAPRVRALKKKTPETVNEISKNFHAALTQFLDFWQSGNRSHKAQLLEALQKHECDVEAMKRSVREFEQGDLF